MTLAAGYMSLSAMLPLLLVIGVGFMLKVTLLKDQAIWNAIDQLNFTILIPALIIANLIGADIASMQSGQITLLVIAALGIVAMVAVISGLILPPLRTNAPAFTSVFQTVTRWNASIAIVICSLLFPDNAVAIVAIMMIAIMPLVNLLNIWLMVRWLDRAGASPLAVMIKVLTNPIIIGCFIGIALALSPVKMPPTIVQPVAQLGDASIATILLSLGAGLRRVRLGRDIIAIALSCLLRLVLAPSAVLGGGMLLSVDPDILAVATIAMAMPTAANGYVMAQKMGVMRRYMRQSAPFKRALRCLRSRSGCMYV